MPYPARTTKLSEWVGLQEKPIRGATSHVFGLSGCPALYRTNPLGGLQGVNTEHDAPPFAANMAGSKLAIRPLVSLIPPLKSTRTPALSVKRSEEHTSE